MKGAKPIRNKQDVQKLLHSIKNPRNFLFVYIGLYTGIRVGDIIKLKYQDIEGNYIQGNEEKTGKHFKTYVPELQIYLKELKGKNRPDDYIFKSRQKDEDGVKRHISTTQAYRILKESGNRVNLDISLHTLRKTFSYHFYNATQDLYALSKALNHDSLDNTAMYLPKDILDRGEENIKTYQNLYRN